MNIIAGKYSLIESIGKGAFGTIWKGVNRKTRENVIIKMENSSPSSQQMNTLQHETTILNLLYSKYCRNIPPIYWYGQPIQGLRVLVMPQYTMSLAQYIEYGYANNPDIQSFIMRSAIHILNEIHDKYVIHRDIKPANWMMRGGENTPELILIDFGLAGFYVNANESHIEDINSIQSELIGTPKYASWNIHAGHTPSRRDDLISLAYIGLYMQKSSRGRTAPISGALWETCPPIVDSPSLPPASLIHPHNLWLYEQKRIENVIKYVMALNDSNNIYESSTKLCKFIECLYSLGFPERPMYAEYKRIWRTDG